LQITVTRKSEFLAKSLFLLTPVTCRVLMVGEENPEQFLFPSIEVADRRTTTTPRGTNILVSKKK